jgi:hypothetical protein
MLEVVELKEGPSSALLGEEQAHRREKGLERCVTAKLTAKSFVA